MGEGDAMQELARMRDALVADVPGMSVTDVDALCREAVRLCGMGVTFSTSIDAADWNVVRLRTSGALDAATVDRLRDGLTPYLPAYVRLEVCDG